MEKAINTAIESGWKFRNEHEVLRFTFDHKEFPDSVTLDLGSNGRLTGVVSTVVQELLLDPLFWSALGKGLEWNEDWYYRNIQGADPQLYSCCDGWLMMWHRFIDHLAEGKDINSFFEDLIK